MNDHQHAQPLDTSALPTGDALSEYVSLAREETFRMISLHAIASDEMIEMWVPIEAMKRVGWNARMEHWEGVIENKQYNYRQLERKFLIVIDQDIYVSGDGVVGLDNIGAQVEQELRAQIARKASEERQKRFPGRAIMGLVEEDMQWRRVSSFAPVQSPEQRLQKFTGHPHSQACIDSVAAALSARLLADKTPTSSPSISRFRL